jgi:thiamine pyrophosphate-dependent acetolactate synthase large subunit-like protein
LNFSEKHGGGAPWPSFDVRVSDMARAMGGWSERVERPEDVAGAFARARKVTEGGQAALLEFITSQETRFSNRGALR